MKLHAIFISKSVTLFGGIFFLSSDLLQLDTPRSVGPITRTGAVARAADPVVSSPFATPVVAPKTASPPSSPTATVSCTEDVPCTKLDFEEPASPPAPCSGPINLLENATPLLQREAARSPSDPESQSSVSSEGQVVSLTVFSVMIFGIIHDIVLMCPCPQCFSDNVMRCFTLLLGVL